MPMAASRTSAHMGRTGNPKSSTSSSVVDDEQDDRDTGDERERPCERRPDGAVRSAADQLEGLSMGARVLPWATWNAAPRQTRKPPRVTMNDGMPP